MPLRKPPKKNTSRLVKVILSPELLRDIDVMIEGGYAISRSEFMRDSLRYRILALGGGNK